VTLLVDLRVEPWRATACPAFGLAVTNLVCGLRDGAGDPAPAQRGPVRARTVSLVREHSVRPHPRSPATNAGDPDPGQHRLKLGTVCALPSGHQERQRLATLLGAQLCLGGPATPRATQRMISRFDIDTARRFMLQIPLCRAPAAC
jgi:hypothetical protein